MSESRGAWPFYYELGLDRRDDPDGRDAHGIYALKAELIYNGFGGGHIDPLLPYWGNAVTNAVKSAQAIFGVKADGVLGPVTARCLFRHRFAVAEAASLIPPHSLAKIATLESDDDPVAQGEADLDDEGILQENAPANPDLTQVQCWTPGFIIPHGASQLRGRIHNCGGFKAGIAAWNVGNFYATQWKAAGYPTSGLPVMIDGEEVDMFARATDYYVKVQAQPL